MKVGVIGGGAIGLLVASYLAENHEVTIYTRTNEQAMRIRSEGITRLYKRKKVTYFVRAMCLENNIVEDVVIIAVKQYQLSALPIFTAPVIFLQNGMGHVEMLSIWTNETIVIGVVEHGAFRHHETCVEHTGLGVIRLALFRGNTIPLLDEQIDNFPLFMERNYLEMLTKKLIVNAVINPLTAHYHVANGKLVEKDMLPLTKKLFDEVAEALKLEIDQREVMWNHVISICEKTAKNYSSMLKDVMEGRQTEVDAILGFIVKSAKKVPICWYLYEIIK